MGRYLIPESEQIDNWHGPFVARTDYHTNRPAVWVNCGYCRGLIVRSLADAKTNRIRSHGIFCSSGCASASRRALLFKICAVCSQPFKVTSERRKKRTCSWECYRTIESQDKRMRRELPLQIYAFEHGIKPDRTNLVCEFCGAEQFPSGKPTNLNTQHWNVRLALIGGQYIARCKQCYAKVADENRRQLEAMSPAKKLRLMEARQLIKEFTNANS